ncbi:TetR/AcrR family transcriptional regulator [Streptomyces broussonetiae]|uniref:TetR/AcrR family transcriptional regulator n=1 Tax=Streptomyces broussonetiae TaxID=2686304 RepID=A0ABV5E539_9ACTN
MAKDGAAGRAARASVWLVDRPRRSGRGGGQPSGLDRERITEATVRLLDAEGLARFSMRRLAAELNVTAMSVYWYVDTKDDLLELALDAVHGELRLPAPEDDTADWREQLRALAHEYRALLVRHPWLSPLVGTYLNIGPNSLAFSRAVQRVVRRTGLPAHGVSGAISAVFRFVYGYGTVEGHFLASGADSGMAPDDCFRRSVETVTGAPETLERDFVFALDLLIAGIEAMTARG